MHMIKGIFTDSLYVQHTDLFIAKSIMHGNVFLKAGIVSKENNGRYVSSVARHYFLDFKLTNIMPMLC